MTDLRSRLGGWLHRAWVFSRRTFLVVVVLAVVLVAARVALPYVLRAAINQRLSRIPDYRGHVESVHVAVWRGAYELRNLDIVKVGKSGGEPFFSARSIDFSLAWRELFHRKIVSDIKVDGAQLNFVKAPTAEASQLAVDQRWQEVVQDIFPIEITYFEIAHGRLHYADTTRTPALDVAVNDLKMVATGLRNRREENGEDLPARLSLEGETVGNGRLLITGAAEPLATQPNFELRVTLQDVNLPALNPLLHSYAGVDVGAGTFRFYFEMAAKDGRFQGYAKPFFSQIKFNLLDDPKKSILEKTWELIASGLVKLLKNKERDELAMRVPFAGEFGQTQVGIWATVASLLRNGFIEALPPVLERSVKSSTIPPPSQPVAPPPAPKPVPETSK